MTFEDLLSSQLEYVQQCFSDFEALKRVWLRSQGGAVDGFGEYEDNDNSEPPELLSPFDSDTTELQAYEEIEALPDDDEKSWNRLVAPWESEYGHRELAPPSLFTDYSMIDAEDPDFARGIRLGLPTYVSLHVPHAGNMNFPGYGNRPEFEE